MSDYETDEAEEVSWMELQVAGQPVCWVGVTHPDGYVYLNGDLHPLGSATALIKAAKEHVPYVALSAVRVMFPAEWLAAECLHDEDRLRVINNLIAEARRQ